MIDIGKRIKQFREERGLTLKNVSDATGLSIGFLSQIERNITDPSIASLKKIGLLYKQQKPPKNMVSL